ncbi:MAG: F0F1 ATP synthase subunit A [Kiritimatiellae bacterium]|nr:F0F1 ATP synthase subunit A [Kiritimatiellia bacterium]
MHHIPRQVLKSLTGPFGIDLSITNEVILLWVSAAATFILLFLAFRRRDPIAKGVFQNLFEALVEMVDRQIVRESIGEKGRMWTPFVLSLFFFILFSNLLGLLPYPSHIKSITSNINVTLALAGVVFVTTIGINLRQHGFTGFMKKFAPSGAPAWILPLLVPIEVISWLAKPCSLAIRLCANMMAGHALIFVFITMAMVARPFLAPIPLVGAIVLSAFELFVCFIQAAIFAMLTGIYIGTALEEAH